MRLLLFVTLASSVGMAREQAFYGTFWSFSNGKRAGGTWPKGPPPPGGIRKYRKEGMILLRSWNSAGFLGRTVRQGQASTEGRGKAFGVLGFSAFSCSRKGDEEIVGCVSWVPWSSCFLPGTFLVPRENPLKGQGLTPALHRTRPLFEVSGYAPELWHCGNKATSHGGQD